MERLLCVFVPALADESPDGATLRTYLALLDALGLLCPFTEPVRLGLYAMPTRGPSRFFGGEAAVLDAVAAAVGDVARAEARLGVADGLFCAELAARRAVVVPVGATDAFRRAQALDALGRRDLATTGRRLGLHTVGAFADLAASRVAERFDGHALVLHQVARGLVGELPGQRDPRLAARLARLRGEARPHAEQRGFFGGRGAGDDRAEAAAHRVRRRLGRRRGVRRVGARRAPARGPRHARALGRAGPAPRRRALARPARRPAAGDDAGALRARPTCATRRRRGARERRAACSAPTRRASGSRRARAWAWPGTPGPGRSSSGGGRARGAARTCRWCSTPARRCCWSPSRGAGGSAGIYD